MKISLRQILVVAPVLALSTVASASAMTHEPPAPKTATMHLRVVPVSGFDTRDGYVAISKDFNASGKRVGSDVTTCRGRRTHPAVAHCDVALALSLGIIHITFTQTAASDVAHGSITGGTGEYRGVSGSVVIHERARSAAVVLTIRR